MSKKLTKCRLICQYKKLYSQPLAVAGAGAGSLSGNFMKAGAETNSFDVYLSTKQLSFL
jgi:hypothetical protein